MDHTLEIQLNVNEFCEWTDLSLKIKLCYSLCMNKHVFLVMFQEPTIFSYSVWVVFKRKHMLFTSVSFLFFFKRSLIKHPLLPGRQRMSSKTSLKCFHFSTQSFLMSSWSFAFLLTIAWILWLFGYYLIISACRNMLYTDFLNTGWWKLLIFSRIICSLGVGFWIPKNIY